MSQLDPALHKRALAEWMKDIGAPADATRWSLSDCDLKDPVGPPPLRVQFVIVQRNAGIKGLIVVGTERQGTIGQPRFLGMDLMIGHANEFDAVANLSELLRLLSRAKASTR